METVTFGSIDLGVENLGVWVGKASVSMVSKAAKAPVECVDSALKIHTRDRTYSMETLYWDRINLTEDLPSQIKIVKKKGSAALHRQVIKPSIEVQVAYAVRDTKIPRVIERMKELGVTHVLIESQLTNLMSSHPSNQSSSSGNILMKVLSHIIQAFLIRSIPDVEISFVSGHSTIPFCEDIIWAPLSQWTQTLGEQREPRGTPRTKPQKKSLAKMTTKYILQLIYGSAATSHAKGVPKEARKAERAGYPPVFKSYLVSKKKDDLADSFLQVMGFLRRSRLTPASASKSRSAKPQKKKRGSDDEIHEPLEITTSRMDKGMFNQLTKKMKPPKLTMAMMRGALDAWHCKGFKMLKKAELTQFFDKAKEARAKAGKSTDLPDLSATLATTSKKTSS